MPEFTFLCTNLLPSYILIVEWFNSEETTTGDQEQLKIYYARCALKHFGHYNNSNSMCVV